MNPISIPFIFGSFFSFFSGIFVLSRNYRRELNQSFAFVCSSITVWLTLYAVLSNLRHISIGAELLSRIAYCGITFIPITVLHYGATFLDSNPLKNFSYFSYPLGILISFLILNTNFIIEGLRCYSWGIYPIAGKYHPFFLIYFFIPTIIIIFKLYIELRHQKDATHITTQLKYMLVAFIIFSFASFDFLPNYGINIIPIGPFPTVFFIMVIAIAIVKYRLMNIEVIVGKSVTYSLLLTIITLVYFLLILILESFSRFLLGYSSRLVSIIATIIIAIFFAPLKAKIEKFIEKYFYKRTIDQLENENILLKQQISRQQRLKTVATLASGIAHEIKNPLTAIHTFVEYLPKKKNDPQFLDNFSKIVKKEVDRIDSLVHQLLDFAKPKPLSLSRQDIHQLIRDTLCFLNTKFVAQNINVSEEFQAEIPYSYVDPVQFKQALLNILLNAIDAMPHGGLLQIKTANETHHRKAYLIISIQDSGLGISKADVPRIFDPFFTQKDNGTGLGLSITNEIVRQHGGIIHVQSSLEEGTTFTIRLPLTPSPSHTTQS